MESDQQSDGGRQSGKREKVASPRPDARYPVAFVDSSAIVALVDRDDRTHGAAVEAYRSLISSGYRLFTTNHVLAETYGLLYAGVGAEVARRWLREMRLAIYTTDEEDEEKARRMVTASAETRTLTLTDALSIVVMERLGVTDAFAVDPDFLAALA